MPRGRSSPARSVLQHLQHRRRGQALVELAIILPVFLVLAMAAIDLGRLFFAQISVANAAREGAYDASYGGSYAANSACGSSNSVMCAVLNEAQGSMTIAPADVVMTCSTSGGCTAGAYGDSVTVQVTGHFKLLTPVLSIFFGGTDVTFTSSASADMVDTVSVALPGGPTAAPSSGSGPTAAPTIPPAPTVPPGPTSPPVATPSPAPTAGPTAPTCSLPFANFTTSQARKQDPVNFTSTSTPNSGTCQITFWRWDFGDGTTDAKTVPTTSHDYGNQHRGETFNVTLTVTNPAGSISVIKQVTTLN